MAEKLLGIKDLYVIYKTDEAVFKVINGINLELCKGETLGLVGETGAGKTTTALSIMKLLPKRTGKIVSGTIEFDDLNITELSEDKMKLIRGERISIIFQDPMTSLNPIITVGDQIAEVIKLHENLTKMQVSNRVDNIMELVGIPCERKSEYPHQFSGGMKQRVMIAMALACEPELIIADEPTTALDVTIQAQVLDIMDELKQKLHTSMLLITHDLGVVARICDKVAIMYAGEIIEAGTAEDLFEDNKHHPYTEGLFGSIPDLYNEAERLSPIIGLMPDPTDLPSGCKFHPRCPKCMEICRTDIPREYVCEGHRIKCHLFNNSI